MAVRPFEGLEVSLALDADYNVSETLPDILIRRQDALKRELVLPDNISNILDRTRAVLNKHGDPMPAVPDAGDIHKHPEDITVRDNSRESITLNDRKSPDIIIMHKHCGLFNRRIGGDR